MLDTVFKAVLHLNSCLMYKNVKTRWKFYDATTLQLYNFTT